VGSSINFNTVAAWTTSPVAANLASGTVTTVDVEPGQEVGPGSVLYTVNLRPTVIAQGGIPGFRDLLVGAEGADVAQLQVMLASLGFYTGPTDGGFWGATESAVESWQKSLGVERTGVVQASDIVFVPVLPTRIALDTERVRRGAVLSGGEAVVLALPESPSFAIPLTADQATLVPTGARVQITGPSGEEWEGVAQQQKTTESGVDVVLAGPDDRSICGEECASIPIVGRSTLRSRIITVETVTGLTVPSAALVSGPNGEVFVIDDDGFEHRVTVTASAKGMSVIRGVPEGLRVRVPAADQ
jgi:peptidoglycan hydrolase-like protein with peptidoglycan-binding domain